MESAVRNSYGIINNIDTLGEMTGLKLSSEMYFKVTTIGTVTGQLLPPIYNLKSILSHFIKL